MADTRVIPIEEHSMMTHSEISTETHITGVKVVSIKSKSSSEFTKNGILYILIFPLSYIREKFQPGDLKGSVLTIFATATGVGVLSLPYAVNLSGLYQGIVLFIFGMIASLYSCQLLVLTAEKTGQLTYQLIGNELYGPRMKTFTEINMIINTYGGVIAYIILIKDLVPNCLKLFEVTNSIATNSYIWGSLICTLIIYPLSLKEKISALRYTSLLSCVACIYLSIAITYGFFTMRSDSLSSRIKEAPPAELSVYSIFTAISYVVFSFTCHQNVIPIYHEMQQKNPKRGFQFLLRGLLMALVLYLIIGVFGFLTFYDEYDPITNFPTQILQAAYEAGNVPIIIASISIVITLICGAPLLMKPCRDTTLSILFKTKPTRNQYFFVVTGEVFSALGLALVTPNIGYALNIIGTISCPIISFTLPCLFYIKAFPGKFTRYDIFIAYAVLVIMTIVGLSGFILFWIDIFS